MTPEALPGRLGELAPELGPIGAPVPLAGGLMNHVWRVPVAEGTVVVKHAPPHVAAAPEIPVDPARLGFEARALELLGGTLAGLPGARAPGVLRYFPGEALLVMEDLGPVQDLAARVAAGAVPADEGAELGRFLGALHAATEGDEGLAASHDNAGVQATRQAVQYDAVEEMLRQVGRASGTAGARARELGSRLREPGRCLVMGDLWPPGVVRGDAGELVVLDWEFSHYGQPAQDLGHLAAHLWMQASRGPASQRSAWEAYREDFLAGYREGGLWEDRVLEDATVHAGCEVLARSCGPFAAGFLYAGDPEAARAAAEQAARWIEGRAPGPLG